MGILTSIITRLLSIKHDYSTVFCLFVCIYFCLSLSFHVQCMLHSMSKEQKKEPIIVAVNFYQRYRIYLTLFATAVHHRHQFNGKTMQRLYRVVFKTGKWKNAQTMGESESEWVKENRQISFNDPIENALKKGSSVDIASFYKCTQWVWCVCTADSYKWTKCGVRSKHPNLYSIYSHMQSEDTSYSTIAPNNHIGSFFFALFHRTSRWWALSFCFV